MTTKKPKEIKSDFDPIGLVPEGFRKVDGDLRAVDPHPGDDYDGPLDELSSE